MAFTFPTFRRWDVVSYDVLAFDSASTTDDEFPAWWHEQSRWSESHSYNDSAVTTPALRGFYSELIRTFPPMNGPDAPTNEAFTRDGDLESRLTDYTIGTTMIYACFAWSQEPAARDVFAKLAKKHGVAICWVSDTGEIVRPRKKLWNRQ